MTVGQGETRSGTRVSTLAIDASLLTRAFAVADALRSAARWCSNVFRHARARWRVVDNLTLSIGAAG